jgi:hypothetical protein
MSIKCLAYTHAHDNRTFHLIVKSFTAFAATVQARKMQVIRALRGGYPGRPPARAIFFARWSRR